MVINKNGRARPGQRMADPVLSLSPQIDTTEGRRCDDEQVGWSAWLCAWIDSSGQSRRLYGRGGDRTLIPMGAQSSPFGWEYPGEDTSWVARGGGETSGKACRQAGEIPRGVSGSCNMIGWLHYGCEDR